MKEVILVPVVVTVLASVLSFLFQLIFNKFMKSSKEYKQDVVNGRLALQALLRTELRRYGKIYIAQGWIDDADKYDYDNLYNRYHNLGKNGVMDDLYNKVMQLPTVKPKQ